MYSDIVINLILTIDYFFLFLFVNREQMLEAILEASRHLLVPEMSQNKAGFLARQVAGSLLQVNVDMCSHVTVGI